MTSGGKPVNGPRLRRLTDEEIDLWLAVAETVERRPGAILPDPLAEPMPLAPEEAAPAVSRSFFAAPYAPKPQAPPAPFAPLERKVRQKLARGRLRADAAIDLHGFRQTEAHSALRHFLHQAQRDGARIVLVVTGKGGRGGDPFDIGGVGIGVLKRSVPQWLAQPDLRALVVGFEEAGSLHGGAGALYVRLRRRERG